MRLVIVGGGYVGMEKLTAVVLNSPATHTTLVAKEISPAIRELAAPHPSITLIEKPYEASDLANADIVIAAVNDRTLSSQVHADAKALNKLINVADKPELCDFYLSSVVQKGNLKIAISTNGKSPTVAKRVKEMINDIIPEEIDSLLDNIQAVRQQLKGDFEDKVRQLNELTKVLSAKKTNESH